MLHEISATRFDARCDRCLRSSPVLDVPAEGGSQVAETILYSMGWKTRSTPSKALLFFCPDCPGENVLMPVRKARRRR